MLIAFETKSSPVLEQYLNEYQHPDEMFPSFKNILTMFMYGLYFERKVYRLDDVVIFEQKGFIEKIMGYALLFLVATSFLAVFLNLGVWLNINLFLMIPCMLFMSPKYHLISKIWKLKRRGHKEKIGTVSNSYIIHKFLYRFEHGTTGSV